MPSHTARRATTDDLEQLIELWETVRYPAKDLEKRFTDFYVAVDEKNQVAAAIALDISGKEGRVHSEAILDSGLTDVVRPLLWERVQRVANNQGLFRLWTEEHAPYWKKDAGFSQPPAEELLRKLPEAFGPAARPWLMLRLREEAPNTEALEHELALFKQAEQAKREDLYRRARLLNIIGVIIAALVLFFIAYKTILVMVWKHQQ